LPMRVDHAGPKPEMVASRGDAQTGARSPLLAPPTPTEAGEDIARSDFRTVSPFPLHQLTIGVDRRRGLQDVPATPAFVQPRPKPPPHGRPNGRHG